MLINGSIWLIAAALALYNGLKMEPVGIVWVLVAGTFAITGLRNIVKHFKGQKKAEEE